MTLRSWIRDRSTTVATVVLAVAALLVWLLQQWLGPNVINTDFVGPPRSGYVLSNFRMWTFNQQGLPSFSMVAPHLERREDDQSLYINTPDYELPSNQAGVPPWKGNSQFAWVDKSGTLLKLTGPVYMHRDAFCATAEAKLHTTDVTAWPKENRMETAAPAHMTQGDSTLDGVGLRANLTTNHLELFDESHGTFPPRKDKSQAAAVPAGTNPACTAAGAGKKK